MKRNRKTAFVLAGFLAIISIVTSWIVFSFLPVSPERLTMTAGCFVIGIVCSLVLYTVITNLADKHWVRVTCCLLFTIFVLIPIASAIVPRITYSRFGFTVYGATPIPVLDITVNRYGILWFRPKTHQITRAELDSLITPGVEVVVVGIGWDSIAQLTDDAKLLGDSIDLRVLPTPEAFALYNRLKADGRNVVLLAHSTC